MPAFSLLHSRSILILAGRVGKRMRVRKKEAPENRDLSILSLDYVPFQEEA